MKVIIHGGFFSESDNSEQMKLAKQSALRDIVSKTHEFLSTHSAVETVAFAVTLLENDPLFNAGLGSQIQSDGKIRLSASIMNGNTRKFSGVINIEAVKNPVLIAQELLKKDDRVLSGSGAEKFARAHGFQSFNPATAERQREFQRRLEESRKGTVGCVALDADGNIAAATSTGGKGFEIPCRVSDSATTAGNFANRFAGVSCTGIGEDIVSVSLASSIATRVADGFTLRAACEKSFAELKTIDGFAGVIAISADGTVYQCESHPKVVWASYIEKAVVFQ